MIINYRAEDFLATYDASTMTSETAGPPWYFDSLKYAASQGRSLFS